MWYFRCMQIIFDTNAYRHLTFGKSINIIHRDFAAITGAEQRMGFMVLMAPIPWLELFAHLADPHDPAFDNCLGAVIGSYIHSRLDVRDSSHKLMSRPEMLKAGSLFEYADEEENEILRSLDSLAGDIFNDPSVTVTSRHSQYLQQLRAFNKEREEDYLSFFELFQEFYHAVLKDKVGTEQVRNRAFFDRWIDMTLRDTAAFSHRDLSKFDPEAINGLKSKIEDYFSTPFYLALDILTMMTGNPAFRIRKNHRENWYWDYQMLFYISRIPPFILVTKDGDMTRAATAAGIESRIMGLEEYLRILQLNISVG